MATLAMSLLRCDHLLHEPMAQVCKHAHAVPLLLLPDMRVDVSEAQQLSIRRPCREAQDKPAWQDRTCATHTWRCMLDV